MKDVFGTFWTIKIFCYSVHFFKNNSIVFFNKDSLMILNFGDNSRQCLKNNPSFNSVTVCTFFFHSFRSINTNCAAETSEWTATLDSVSKNTSIWVSNTTWPSVSTVRTLTLSLATLFSAHTETKFNFYSNYSIWV